MNTKENLSKFPDSNVRTLIRSTINKVNEEAYDKESYRFVVNGIFILGEAVFLGEHGKIKGMPRLKISFFSEFFDEEFFSRGIEGMVRSGVFYNIERHTHHLSDTSGSHMEKPVLVEYVKLYLRWMIAQSIEEGGCQAGPMKGFDFSSVGM